MAYHDYKPSTRTDQDDSVPLAPIIISILLWAVAMVILTV